MLSIISKSLDPFFNLACEEYLFNTLEEDCFLLYRNESAVIVGKHQNALAEINYQFVRDNNIKVVRRLSGGGAVYHDPGNINFCFITKVTGQNKVDFKKYLSPIVAILNKAGIPAEVGERNNLVISGMKISGNAEHIYKDKVLHHGTLLFSTDLEILKKSLSSDNTKYSSKAVRSVSSNVTNISDHSKALPDIDAFARMLSTNLSASFEDCVDYKLSETDIHAINKLAQEKYAQWDWNFGYSPAYLFNNKGLINDKEVVISMEVEQGAIKNISIRGNYFTKTSAEVACCAILGIKHEETCIMDALEKAAINMQNDINFAAFVNLLF